MERIPYVNREVAQLFKETARLLDAQGANPQRVQAYLRAASFVELLEESVSVIHEKSGIVGLEKLPFIGRSLAEAIRDIVLHGTFHILERLRGHDDYNTLFTRLPGVGPELARRLHDLLGVETLEQLEIAAQTGRLETLPGFGNKRIQAIKESIATQLGR